MRALALAVLLVPAVAAADTTSGVDGALFRSSYDTNGIFAVEGARLMPKRDISMKALLAYGLAPIELAVPGIGTTGDDKILEKLVTLDLAFGMSLTDRIAIGIDVAAFKTATGDGYGVRGRYMSGGLVMRRSTGLVALRPLSNIDPSADNDGELHDGLSGPLDARLGIKVGLITRPLFAVTAIASMFLPFGEDEMLLGDRDVVIEPKLAAEVRPDRVRATRVVANVAARFRKRSVLESYDAADMATNPDADARVMLDVGGEVVLGLGGVYEVTSRIAVAGEIQLFAPLEAVTYGGCRRFNGSRCDSITASDYTPNGGQGDFTSLLTLGASYRATTDVTINAMVGTSLAGARGESLRGVVGLAWQPQIAGAAAPGSADRDSDGVPDTVDACVGEAEDRDDHQDEDGCADPDNDSDGLLDGDDRCPNQAEDKDGYQDEDGCPERDNDSDGLADGDDRCPSQAEDTDGFEDADGCPDDDNDADGFKDDQDRCPNDAETVNGIDDDDGCPDARGTTGPEERADRIDLKGQPIGFTRSASLTPAAKRLLDQVATIVKQRHLALRVEVHVPLGTKAKAAKTILGQKKRDKMLSQVRAQQIVDYLISQGVSANDLSTAGFGADRPLPNLTATDPQNERVDLIKVRTSNP